MKKFISKKSLFWLSLIICIIIPAVLFGVSNHWQSKLLTQNMAGRWADEKETAQISCFFSRGSGIDENRIKGWEYGISQKLKEASIEPKTETGRLWADAYSASGKITLKNGKSSVDASAVGIGGDFFLFHPLKLLEGSYFSGNDVLQDYVIIDEYAAWQLFGSNDIIGMQVTIQDVPHVIAGVIEREQGKLEKAAGGSEMLVYVSYQTLQKYGTDYGINHYEIVMPNPVKDFAKQMVTEQIAMDEKNVEIIENSTRFDFLQIMKVAGQFGSRSMSRKGIIYPYWENVARGTEDKIALLTIIALGILVYPLITAIIFVVRYWKKKKWTFKSVFHKIKDYMEEVWIRIRNNMKKKREDKEDEEFE